MLDFLKCLLDIQSILVLHTNGMYDIKYFLNTHGSYAVKWKLRAIQKSSNVLSLTLVAQGEHINTKRICSPYLDSSLGSSELTPCKSSIQVILAGMSISTNDCCHLHIAIFYSLAIPYSDTVWHQEHQDHWWFYFSEKKQHHVLFSLLISKSEPFSSRTLALALAHVLQFFL